MEIALLLGAVYAVAVVAKARSQQKVAEYLRPLTTHGAIVTRIAIAIEVGLTALLFIAAADFTVQDVAGASSAVFVIGATATHAALLSRRGPGTCHCFGRLSASTARVDPAWLPAFFALRNAAFVSVSLVVAHAETGLIVAGPLVVAGIVSSGLLGGISQERRLMRRETHPTAEIYGPGMRTLMAHTWWVDGHPRAF